MLLIKRIFLWKHLRFDFLKVAKKSKLIEEKLKTKLNDLTCFASKESENILI